MHTQINIFERPIERIRRTCELLGLADDFERKLPQLETHLESLVADGETNEERLAASGLPSSSRFSKRQAGQEISSGSFQPGSGSQRSSRTCFTW